MLRAIKSFINLFMKVIFIAFLLIVAFQFHHLIAIMVRLSICFSNRTYRYVWEIYMLKLPLSRSSITDVLVHSRSETNDVITNGFSDIGFLLHTHITF